MKRFITILLFACVALCAAAQDEMLQKIIAANTFDSVQASFSQVRHSSLMTDDLKSEGKVWLQAPDKVRWEVTSPFSKVTVFNGDIPSGRRFRMPSAKDFEATVLKSDVITVNLVPRRSDLGRMFRQIVLTLDPETLLIKTAMLINPDGDWTSLTFRDIVRGVEIDDKLFEK